MPFAGEWCKVWIYFGFVFAWAKGARPRFDTSADMRLVLVPADAEVDSVIFRLRATDQDADFPLVFEITATITPVVRIDNLPCTLYNKVCQANVILTKRLVAGRFHDFAVRVRDTKGDSNSMQATISVTNATTPRDKIFPHIPSLIMVPEDTKPGKELDYLLARANSWSGKPVYIELWQPKELFTIRQRQTPTQTRGIIVLTGELDFETQSMYTLTIYATDPYTEQGKDTRNIAGLSIVVIVRDVQDVPPIFTLAPPLTKINNSVQPGDIVLRVHAEDGDKGVPREIVYGLVSEGNPFTPFFNISETNGEISLARPLEELTQITHVGAPVVLTVVAEEIRRSREEPPAQATVVDVGFLLGEPGNSPPYFESDKLVPETYIATIDENPEPGTVINFGEQYSTRVKDEDIGKAGVFALKLENNNNTFEISPTVAERTADFVVTVRDNAFIDYERYKVLSFKIVAQEVGPATNLSASVPATVYLRDVNDNPPIFDEVSYEVTLSENVTAGSRVIQVHATDKDTGVYGSIRYTSITGEGSEAFTMDSQTGFITVAMGSSLDREVAATLVLTVEARDENGNGNSGVVPLIVNLIDVNDNAPRFEKDVYDFMLNSDLTNFTSPALVKAIDDDAEPPNNVVRYELIHGNYENKFYLNETSGELTLLSPITKIRRKKQSSYEKLPKRVATKFTKDQRETQNDLSTVIANVDVDESSTNNRNLTKETTTEVLKKRRRRADDPDALYTLTARAYDLGVPHLSSVATIRILSGAAMEARIMMFVVPGEQPDSTKTAETLAAITGGRVTVLETRPYVQQNYSGNAGILHGGGKKSIIVARVEQTEPGTPLVDVEKIREALAANGVGIIGGNAIMNTTVHVENTNPPPVDETPRVNDGQTTLVNNTVTTVHSEEVTVYKAENKLLMWLLIILGLLMLLAIAALIVCCICPGCPFYMAPRKRRVHSSETLVVRSDGRPKRHLHRQPAIAAEASWNGRKQAWSADPTRRNWQFNKRNVKNCSLPGDVAYVTSELRQPSDFQMTIEAQQRLRDGASRYDHSRRSRLNEQERMYMEDVEEQKARRGYRTAELDSLQRHEVERGSDLQHQAYRQRFMEPDVNVEEPTVREQHFYREGNAEVLRLVTRGQLEDTSHLHRQASHHHRPTALIVDGKDIILQRFIEDQKSRHELSMQDIEAARSMESHQRSKEVCQQQQPPEIILIPERLDHHGRHRQHQLSSLEEIGPTVQRLVIDHGDYGSQKTTERESQMREKQESVNVPIADKPPIPDVPVKEQRVQVPPDDARYSFHDLELARQNALLTRLLLERESRRAGGGGMDSTSYLETQSLPGQVAIATQTDRTAATQTEHQAKSRSDNDESDNEESRHRRRLKSRKRYGEGDWRRCRAPWTKSSPIEKEARRSPCFDKRLSILRKKVREVKEGRKISLEPGVLREISDSLDGNGSSCKGEEDERTRRSYQRTEQTSISYKILNEKKSDSQSSEEKRRKSCEDDRKANATGDRSASSSEVKVQRERREKSPRKEARSKKTQRRSDGGATKPSFRILEKEFTMLTKKLSKLGERRKFQESFTGSTDEKSERSFAKKTDSSSSQKQTAMKAEQGKGKQGKDSAIAKTKQKLKYQQSHQVMSTGSSELDDGLDKPKKSIAKQQRQPIGIQSHAKVKRQAQIDRRESKRQSTLPEYRDEEVDTPKPEPKPDKLGRLTRAPKLAVVSRKQNVSEETSTSATEEKKDGGGTFSTRDLASKKSSTDLSEGDSNASNRRGDSTTRRREAETLPRKIIPQRFSDDFVEEPKAEVSAVTEERETKSDATGQVSDNEPGTLDSFDKLAKRLSKDASTKGTIDDQLITGSTKKETRTARDRWMDKASWGTESTESIRHADMVMKKEEIAQTDKSMSETERDVARRVQRDYKAKDESLDEEFEITAVDGRLKEKKQEEEKMRKLSKDLARQSVALEGLDETETPAGEKSAYISSDYVDRDKGIMLDVEDKVDVKEESKRGPEVKDHMRKEEERTKKIEEPSEEYVETEISSDGTTEVCRKKEVEVDETDREEEKQTRHAKDVSTLDYVATEEKKIEFNVRDKGKIDLDAIKVPCEHEKETHDGKVEGDVLLDEWEKYEDKDAEKMKSTFGDRDKSIGDEKKEVVARDTAEDSEETTVETTGDQKFEEETLEKIATDSTKDRRVTEDSKTSEDEKTDEKVTEESRISKQATTDKKISEETTKETRNGDKVAGELPAEREIVETAKEEEQQSVREKEGYQIAERTSSEDDAAAGHLGIVAKAIDFVEREKIFDEEKKIWTETDTERETVFLDKVKRSDTADVRSDDRETSLDGEGFSEESQKKRSSPEGEGICMKKEGQIVTGDLEVSKGDVSTGKEEEMVILEKEDASREKEEKEASAIDDKEEKITEKASDHRIGEKETSKGARETDEDRVSDEKIANIEQQPLTEKKDDASTIRRDKTEKDDSLKVSTSHREKQDGEETKVLIETPASISDDVKEEAPMEAETPAPDDHHSKRDSVFLEAFETVHSLVDTLTNGKTPSPKTEAAASEQSLPDKKELSSYREGEKPSTSRVNGDSATSLDQEKVKEDAGGGKSIDSTDSNKLTTGSTKEKSDEKGPVLTDEREISESLKDDETKDTDVEKLREEKPAEEVVEDNETADEKLAGTTEKEEDRSPGEASGGGTRPQTYATEEKEKFAPDSIISEVTTDSDVPPESGKQLKLESEQTELQEVEQFVGGETFAAAEATFPEKWPSMTVSDVPGTTGWESDNKHDLIVLRMDKTSLAKEDEEERPGVFLEGQSTDVSLPLFTSAIDTADDSEDSDSSSDVSRKTTLTTRPYQTPRHRARRLSEKENNQVEEPIEARSIEDEGKEATVSIGETEDEDSFWIIEGTNVERSSPTKSSEEDKETEELASREKDTEEDEETAVTNTEKEEQFECDPATDKGSSTAGKDEPLKDSRVKPGIKADRQDGSSALASKLAQTETFKVIDKRAKELGRKRVVPQRKKKSSSEESSEEKAAGHRTRRKLSEDQPRQKEQSVEQTKQSGKRDERKQSLSRLKAEREKKSSSSSEKYPTPPKTGEIDTSKAQPKYMAWYKKNREEMERKRAELLATDDEEQLPRWLRRSMRNQKSEKDDRKVEKPSQKKTVDTTPRTRRKVKPLVNVESEQLKAIVRQGRKLRRAEGGKNEDPPVQIFATTPPAVPQDPKHHLLQHSEYKYEKMPVPFYLHPPPAPHPSPQLSPEHFEIPPTVEHRTSEDFDSGIAVSLQQGGNRLRHQQLLEKKSVFDIAYSEAAPSQLRSDSTSPPS